MIIDKLNQINVGVELCHLWLSAIHQKRPVKFAIDGAAVGRAPKGYRYVVSVKMS